MNECDAILERANNITGYLLYGTDADIEHNLSYQDRLANANNVLFDTLKSILPAANKENDALVNAIMDFSMVHNEVYLEIGLIIGHYLSENFKQSCQNLNIREIVSIFK